MAATPFGQRPLALVLLVLLALLAACGPSAAAPELIAKVRAEVAQPAQKAGIAIDFATQAGQFESPTGSISWKPVSGRELDAYTQLFLSEFALYSREFLADIGVRRVYLCSEITLVDQARMALPEFSTHTLYYDPSAVAGGTDYARRVIHHELFHMLDYADDGAVYEDAVWCAINPAGWKYGNGGKNAQRKRDTSFLCDTYPGFLDHYSTTGVEEDKAEVYATLIVSPRTVDMLAARDPVITRKIAQMGVLVAAASPHAGADLWKRIEAPIARR